MHINTKPALKKNNDENQAWEAYRKEQLKNVPTKEEAWERAEKETFQFKYP